MSFKVETLWAFISAGDDGEEGLIGATTGSGTFVPFIAADRARLESLRPMAMQIAQQHAATILLVRFDLRTDVQKLTAAGAVDLPRVRA